jgi:ParB family chromosome partitioning protein
MEVAVMEVKEIKLEQIQLSESNTRKDLSAGTEDAGIEDLANSIKEKGLLNPIIVRKKDDGSYDLIAGQRRFLACQKLGWESIPAIVRDIADDTDATIISLVENVHRADMNPIDKARAYQKIYERYKDYNKVAKETGVSVSTTRKYLTLLNLSPSTQEKLTTAEGPAGISALAKIAETFDPEEQEDVLDRIGGFKQQIQLEMIKRSGGDLKKLEELREQALEGAFDTRLCRGLDGCQFIPEELIEPVKEAIEKFEKEGDITSFKEVVKKMRR